MERSRLLDPDPTIAAPAAARPEASAARLGALAVTASVALHLVGYGVIRIIREPSRPAPATVTMIDLDVVPLAPAPEDLPPEEELEAATRPAAPAPAPPVEDGVPLLDAGVPIDAAVPTDARPPRDAGVDGGVEAGLPPIDAAMVAAADDGGFADGGAGVAAGALDGGSEVAASALDGGSEVAAALDGGVAGDGGGVATVGEPDRTGIARPTTGTAANLLAYAPAGHVVTVLARMDRLRGTEWADRVEAMLAPLPDHRALVGDQHLRIVDLFDTLVISSPDPADALATTLVARSPMAPPALRDLLDQPDAPVAWSPTIGGALGRRLPSPRLSPDDARVFLTWAPGWTTLTRPDDLPGLLAPATIGLDHAFAAADRLPPWLAQVEHIEDESGTSEGPALMLTAGGMFPPSIHLPLPIVDIDLPGPERATLTLTVDDHGFVVRGSLKYADEAAAATASDAIARAQRKLSGPLVKPLVKALHAWNAVDGLRVSPTGARVAFSTAISTADARELLALLANKLDAHFQELRSRRPARPPPPVRPPQPAGPPPPARPPQPAQP